MNETLFKLHPTHQIDEPFLYDLHLLDLLERLNKTAGIDLTEYFLSAAETSKELLLRQDVLRDLCDETVYSVLKTFTNQIYALFKVPERPQVPPAKALQTLRHMISYCSLVLTLDADLSHTDLHAQRLLLFRLKLHAYTVSKEFLSFYENVKRLSSQIKALDYGICITGHTISIIGKDDMPDTDYLSYIEAVFKDFLTPAAETAIEKPLKKVALDAFQEQLLIQISRYEKDLFDDIASFTDAHADFRDPYIMHICRDLKFYLSYLSATDFLKKKMAFPAVAGKDDSENYIEDGGDIHLARLLYEKGGNLVPNDIRFDDAARQIVVTGPNQGGKTTFARMIGQSYYLFMLGLPIICSRARLSILDQIYTHFDRKENESLSIGKLKDDLLRIHEITSRMTSRSLVIANEMFSSTTKKDGLHLATEIIRKIKAENCRLIYITFLDEIAGIEDITSYVPLVDEADPDHRLFKLVKQTPDNKAYTKSLIHKYRISCTDIVRRINA